VRVEEVASSHLPGVRSNLQVLTELAPADPDAATVYSWARTGGLRTRPSVQGDADKRKNTDGAVLSGFKQFLPRLIRKAADLNHDQASGFIDGLRQFDEELGAALTVAGDPNHFYSKLEAAVAWLSVNKPVVPTSQAVLETLDPSAEAALVNEAMIHDVIEEERLADNSVTTVTETYKIYSRLFDEEKSAREWLLPADVDLLDELPDRHWKRTRQLAHRLLMRLQAASSRRWDFELEQGSLDSRRLSQLIRPVPVPRVFRSEQEPRLMNADVSLLVDQSGSMRGSRQLLAAQTIDYAVCILELCGVKCEVLGYTTRFGPENPIARAWKKAGSPPSPGRLNAVRHIIYKDVNQSWRRSRPSLGLMMREGFGRENVDGEALKWAANRLNRRGSRRRILIVLSDGAPFDESTLEANDSTFLESNLHHVVGTVEVSGIRLFALGVGAGVSRFYLNSVAAHEPEEIPDILFKNLASLLLD